MNNNIKINCELHGFEGKLKVDKEDKFFFYLLKENGKDIYGSNKEDVSNLENANFLIKGLSRYIVDNYEELNYYKAVVKVINYLTINIDSYKKRKARLENFKGYSGEELIADVYIEYKNLKNMAKASEELMFQSKDIEDIKNSIIRFMNQVDFVKVLIEYCALNDIKLDNNLLKKINKLFNDYEVMVKKYKDKYEKY